MERIKVVARYMDGKIIKGYTNNFSPNKSSFHMELVSETDKTTVVEVLLRNLKAVFFVKEFAGDASYKERQSFTEGEQTTGRKMSIIFKDGEELIGSTMLYDHKRPGFFFFPADKASNNLKVFIIHSAVREFEFME
jgi:hypothetical protein